MSSFQSLTAKAPAPTKLSHEGGTVFQVDPILQLRRFLILGVGGSFYEDTDTKVNQFKSLLTTLVAENPGAVLGEICTIDSERSALRKDTMIYALAALCSPDVPYEIRREAYGYVGTLCTTGTDFLHWLQFRRTGRTSSRLFRKTISNWFRRHKNPVLQAIKYEQRDGWSLRDALRLAQPVAGTPSEEKLFAWIKHPDKRAQLLTAWEIAEWSIPNLMRGWQDIRQEGVTPADAADIIRRYSLPREAVPGQFLTSSEVWAALITDMPAQATIRNLGKITSLELLRDPETLEIILDKIRRGAKILHPFDFFIAREAYGTGGRGIKSSNRWTPLSSVMHELTESFRKSYGTLSVNHDVSLLVAIDTSASMHRGTVSNPLIACDKAAAALASVLRWQYPNSRFFAYSEGLTHMDITSGSFDEFTQEIRRLEHIGTDCRLPLLFAQKNPGYDGVISLTDNETGVPFSYGARTSMSREITCSSLVDEIHKTHPTFKHAVVAFAANDISVANPHDLNQLDFEGLDASLPKALAMFMDGVL